MTNRLSIFLITIIFFSFINCNKGNPPHKQSSSDESNLNLSAEDALKYAIAKEQINSNPKEPMSYVILAGIYYNNKDFKKASEYYEKAVVFGINHPSAYYMTAFTSLVADLKNKKSALNHLENALKLKNLERETRNRIIHLISMVHFSDKNFEKVIENAARYKPHPVPTEELGTYARIVFFQLSALIKSKQNADTRKALVELSQKIDSLPKLNGLDSSSLLAKLNLYEFTIIGLRLIGEDKKALDTSNKMVEEFLKLYKGQAPRITINPALNMRFASALFLHAEALLQSNKLDNKKLETLKKNLEVSKKFKDIKHYLAILETFKLTSNDAHEKLLEHISSFDKLEQAVVTPSLSLWIEKLKKNVPEHKLSGLNQHFLLKEEFNLLEQLLPPTIR